MDIARTFVSFSSTDIQYYRTMHMWKANENIDFNFADFQVDEAIDSENEDYIKSRCRAKIRRADTFILLIGSDTWTKTTYVKSEVEVAIEKGCRLIGANLNNCRFKDSRCPGFFANKGALFVPFSSRIFATALGRWHRDPSVPWLPNDWNFYDATYTTIGYVLIGNTAVMPPQPNPFLFGKPPWAK